MATSGRDVILTLMADVAELQDNSRSSTGHLERVGDHLVELSKHVEELTRLSREYPKKTERLAQTLAKLADLFGDHEDRITALEARE